MANEAAFRSAINGFNKTDVMSYIETLLLRASEASGVEASLRAKADELLKQLDEAKAETERIKQENAEATATLEASLESCRKSLAASESARLASEAALREAERKVDEIRAELAKKDAEVTSEPEEDMLGIVPPIPDGCSSCDKAKLYEAQLGAAMLDAKRFSEILVKEASDKVAQLLERAGACAVDTSKRARFIADEVKKLTNSFNGVYAQLYKQMNSLVESLDDFSRQAESDRMTYDYHTDFAPNTDTDTAE